MQCLKSYIIKSTTNCTRDSITRDKHTIQIANCQKATENSKGPIGHEKIFCTILPKWCAAKELVTVPRKLQMTLHFLFVSQAQKFSQIN